MTSNEKLEASQELQGIEDAWKQYEKSWKSETDVENLFTGLSANLDALQHKGMEYEVFSAADGFVREIQLRHEESAKGFELAEKIVSQIVDLGNKWCNASINTLVFSSYFDRSMFKESELWLERSIRMNNGDESENSLNNLGIAYMMQGKTAQAVSIFLRSWSLGNPSYRAEAKFHLAHLLGKCASDNWAEEVLQEITYESDSQYAAHAQSCLNGSCGSAFKLDFGAKKYRLLKSSKDQRGSICVELIEEYFEKGDSESVLEELELGLDSFEDVVYVFDQIKNSTEFDPRLLEFCAAKFGGNGPGGTLTMALVLESEFKPHLSAFASVALSLWGLGEVRVLLNLFSSDLFLSNPDFKPELHPQLTFAIHESLLRTLRPGLSYVAESTSLLNWKASLDFLYSESPYFDVLVEQREDGNLESFRELLGKACTSERDAAPSSTKVLALAARTMLEVLDNWDGKSFCPNISSAFYVALEEAGIRDDALELASAEDYINQRFMFMRGAADDKLRFLAIQDAHFLAASLQKLTIGHPSLAFSDAVLMVREDLVSPSIRPIVGRILSLSWVNGAQIDWEDPDLALFPEFLEQVARSNSVSDVIGLSRNNSLLKVLEQPVQFPIRAARGETSVPQILEYIEGAPGDFAMALADARGLQIEAYQHLSKKFGLAGLSRLSVNPDAFQALQAEISEELARSPEFGYLCAKQFTDSSSIDWPRALLGPLVETPNIRALELIASDYRVTDDHLRVLAAKANKTIAQLLNEHPKASDETRALAQLVA